MKEWKYLIGSAEDFIGAPDDASVVYRLKGGKLTYSSSAPVSEFSIGTEIIAQRTESFGNAIDLEFCKANPDHPDCKCKKQQSFTDVVMDKFKDMAVEYKYSSKYNRPCKGVTIDIYDVLQAFTVTNPATQHAIKKLLCAGLCGHKDKMQDLTEALKSIERAIELEKE